MINYSILIPSLIIFLAFFIRSLTGFGGALISIPLLAFFFDLKFAIPMELIFEIVLGLLLICTVYKKADLNKTYPLLLGLIGGNVVGVHILATYPNDFLKLGLGFFVILFSFYLAKTSKNPLTFKISTIWGAPIGFCAGIFGGLFGMSGPLVVLYLASQIKTKETLRATLIVIFFITCFLKLGLYLYNDLFNREMIGVTLKLMPSFLIATFLGHKAHFIISESYFRVLIAAILLVSGILLLTSS